MTHSLTIRLGDRADLDWAQRTVEHDHYLHQRVDARARPMAYVLDYDAVPVGLVMLGIPHATRNTGWWGYPGLPTQWQVVDLCRIWLAPAVQSGNYWCKQARYAVGLLKGAGYPVFEGPPSPPIRPRTNWGAPAPGQGLNGIMEALFVPGYHKRKRGTRR